MRVDSILFNGFESSGLCFRNIEYYRFRVNKKNSSSIPNVYSLHFIELAYDGLKKLRFITKIDFDI